MISIRDLNMHCSLYFLFVALFIGTTLSEEVSNDSNNGEISLQNDYYNVREPRSFHKKKRCQKYGGCEDHGGYQGGYQQGHHGGVPINIAISQSQSSANGADGGYDGGYNPSNYQYNHGPHGGHNGYHGGYNQGYGGYNQGYGGYNQGYGGYKPGYGGFRPGYYGNGQGGYNNQFNGNYFGGSQGGYGFQRPFGSYYDEGDDDYQGNDDSGEGSFAFARSSAVAGSKA